jgi:hypothetical protein
MSFLRYIFLVTLLAASAVVHGQELIKGIVLDSATFAPLAYANVRIKNQNRGTIADSKGSFELFATRSDTLVFSFIGYHDVVYPLKDWEPSMIRMSEKRTLLGSVTIKGSAINAYEGLFDEQNAILNKRKIPFYFAKAKKEKVKVGWLLQDNLRAKNYVDLLIKDDKMKLTLMSANKLSENEYFTILERFNVQYVNVMYYLSTGELMSLLSEFFEHAARQKKTN